MVLFCILLLLLAVIICFQTHVLRKNVQVRKSQSADNLAPAAMNAAISLEHDINLVCLCPRVCNVASGFIPL
mgnify:FL=1